MQFESSDKLETAQHLEKETGRFGDCAKTGIRTVSQMNPARLQETDFRMVDHFDDFHEMAAMSVSKFDFEIADALYLRLL